HGHLSTLHIWWARRPLAACRAAIFAALVPQPNDPREAEQMQEFIAQLADWDNSIDSDSAAGKTGVHHYIRDARAYIKRAFPDRAPRVLDPFAGGGAIPLEALRLGCETYALDLNPVAHIIQLATLVYPQKYAFRSGDNGNQPGATLVRDIRKWGNWVLSRARAEVGDLYPQDPDSATPIAYFWARTVPCPNPSCNAVVPLIRQTWLARKPNKYIAYRVESGGPGSSIRFRVVSASSARNLGFDPGIGTTRGGTATCPSCGTPLSERYIKAEAAAGRLGAVPIAVGTDTPGGQGKRYRDVRATDESVFDHARQRLIDLKGQYDPMSSELPPIPDELLSTNSQYSPTPLYGLKEFGDLFNSRQALTISVFMRHVGRAFDAIAAETGDSEYAKAVTTYLAIAANRLADACSSLVRWRPTVEAQANTFARQAFSMMWDYVEINPFGGSSGDWESCIEWVWKYVAHAAATSSSPADVQRGNAAQLPYADGYFDAVVTDPPYYDSVPYSDLSDFFYVWLRRSIGNLYPAVLGTPLTPKQQEIIQSTSMRKRKEDFERMLSEAFSESSRVLADNGICVVVYAHKAVSAWETLIASLLKAGLTVDGSWPFNTERRARLRGQNSAALASSIFLVCRKRRVDAGVGIAGDVRRDIEANVRERLDDFWQAGLRGADFFISAIGPATAAFSRYDRVMTMGGEDVTVSTLLEWVQGRSRTTRSGASSPSPPRSRGTTPPRAGLARWTTRRASTSSGAGLTMGRRALWARRMA
ncbi:MAG: DUF1156 domain-containing protein, partial [Chloroflexota bacterium]|nr:DUF1156 domain-containing protein [Chloroflexota bacterium]